MTINDEVEAAAEEIYNTHWRPPSPTRHDASDTVRDWIREQAAAAINKLRARGWREPTNAAPACLVDLETEIALQDAGLER